MRYATSSVLEHITFSKKKGDAANCHLKSTICCFLDHFKILLHLHFVRNLTCLIVDDASFTGQTAPSFKKPSKC